MVEHILNWEGEGANMCKRMPEVLTCTCRGSGDFLFYVFFLVGWGGGGA